MMMSLKIRGKISARDVCVLCFYARLAGITGPAVDMSFRPNAPSGHFQRHLDVVTELNSKLEDGYALPVPSYDKYILSRVELDIASLPMHECLNNEVLADPQISRDVASSLSGKDWSGQYRNHPVVQNAGPNDIIYPFAMYLDGVPFQKKDGTLAFYAYNLVTCRRHLLICLRKSQMCKCSCNGWCSLFAVMTWLRWSIEALAKGQLPRHRHDGSNFCAAGDISRLASAGTKMIKGAVVIIKGDWMEYSASLALPFWSSVMHPCFCCHATQDQLRLLGNFSALSSPFVEKTALEYERSCVACEKWVTIQNIGQHQLILGALFFDKRKHGGKGRCLCRDIEELGLLQGDRLEPCSTLRNIGMYENLTLPCRVLFWRPRAQTMSTRRCPLFCPEYGVSIETLTIDPLHCLHLGVYKDYCQTVIWSLILADAWDTRATNQDTLCQVSVQRCRSQLFEWYKMKHKRDPDEALYKLQDLRLTMLGAPLHQTLATKAAETGTLIEFCRDAMQSHGLVKLGTVGKMLLAVGDSLVRCRNVMRSSQKVMSPQELQTLVDNATRAFSLREQAGIPWAPKWHMFLHMCHRAHKFGNPQYQSTFLDESYNGRLAEIAGSCHRMTWHRRVLGSFRYVYSSVCRKRQRH